MADREFPCEFCDTDQHQVKKLVTLARHRKSQWYIFEDVPALVCPNCGHRYFNADVTQMMEDRMTSTPENARPVEGWVMSLSESAN